MKNIPIFIVVIKDMGFASGFIGHYARLAAEEDYIYLGFHCSPGGLLPHGSIDDPWGTNPITIGVPSNDLPVIIDTAMSKIRWNEVEKAKRLNTTLANDVAIDEDGEVTTDPNKLFALKAIAGHKGSALAMGVELLAGALSLSRVGFSRPGGWGSTFILINPEFFGGLDELKKSVSDEIASLKSLRKARGHKEIFFPGEQSLKRRAECLQKGRVDIDEEAFKGLRDL